jgi:hypothetical protein
VLSEARFKSKNDLPPAKGFWSLTMYDSGYFFVANPLNRYTLSERNQLKTNADGSTDLYLQKDNPGPDKESNWLPAPGLTTIYFVSTQRQAVARSNWTQTGPGRG